MALLLISAGPLFAEDSAKPDGGTEKESSAPEASSEDDLAKKRKIGKILKFIEVRVWDDWMRVTVDKIRGSTPPQDDDAANLIEYRTRRTTASAAIRLEAGPLLSGYFRAGVLRMSLHNTIRMNTDLPGIPPGTKVNETTETQLGLEFGLGAEVHLPAHRLFNLGLFYEISYGEADVTLEYFYQSVVEGDYRYLNHLLLLFGEAPIPVKKPIVGRIIPRLDVGAVLYRASADFTAADKSRDWDIHWIGEQSFLLALSVRVELDDGFYILLRGEFIGRGGYLLATGIRF
jgi:hypothetical protein